MNGSRYLLDTNIIAALFNGETVIADKIDAASGIYIPVIVLGELYFGVLNSTKFKKNLKKIQDFSSYRYSASLNFS